MGDGQGTAPHPITRAVSSDAAALTALARDAALPGWSEESLRAAFADPNAVGLVARDGTEAARGFALARRVADEVEILLVAVAPDARRRGSGAALLAATLAEARRGGATTAHLEVRASNAAAIALYERLGFVAVGRRPRYYDATEDAVLMSRALGSEGA